jgi:hypothetical protein
MGAVTALAVIASLLAVSVATAAPPDRAGDVAGASRAAGSRGAILYVGDSLGAGTFPLLVSLMPSRSIQGDTRFGRTSIEGLSVLRAKLRPAHRAVIFDLGTNDWSTTTLTRNLRRARAWIGNRLMVLLTMNKPGVRPFNRAVKMFAASGGNVVLIDWRSMARRQGLLSGDGIHAAYSGYSRRAMLIARVLSR